MLYGRDVINLMRPHPGRAFPVRYFVRSIVSDIKGLERGNVQRQVRRVLALLVEMGMVETTSKGRRDLHATYTWIERDGNGMRVG